MNKKFSDFLADLRARTPNAKIAVAVSGGADSMALMHLCAKTGSVACPPSWGGLSAAGGLGGASSDKIKNIKNKILAAEAPPRLAMLATPPLKGGEATELGLGATQTKFIILHVDHGLRPTSANDAKLVADAAKKLGMNCAVLKWTGKKPKTGLEAAAREARYKLMTEYCRANDIGIILTAHQADDQIETFLMNLGRGSGIYGLGAMRPVTSRDGIILARPLLDISRDELTEYCRANKIKFVNDEMNDVMDFARVRIRKNRHLLRDQLGITDARILTAIESVGRARDAMESKVEDLMKKIQENVEEAPPRPATPATPPLLGGDACAPAAKNGKAIFQASFLFDLPEEIRLKLLSRLIQEIGGLPYPPRLEKIQLALEKLKRDTIFTIGHCSCRRMGEKILIAPEGTSISFRKIK